MAVQNPVLRVLHAPTAVLKLGSVWLLVNRCFAVWFHGCTSTSIAPIAAGVAGCTRVTDRDASADDARNALHSTDRNASRDAFGLRDKFCFTYLFAGRVRNSTCAGLFSHGTRCVRHLLRTCLLHIRAGRVRHLSCAGDRYLTTDCIRDFLFADLRHHPRAADFLFYHAGYPSLATDLLRWPRTADDLWAAGITRIRNTFLHHGAWNTLSVSLPASTADIDSLLFRHWLECRVAAFLVTGLRFSRVRCVANVTITGLVDRFAHVVAAGAIARFVDGLTDCVADVSVARLIDRFADVALHGSITCLCNRSAYASGHIAIAGLVDRLANGVTLVAIARLINVANALNRDCFCAVVVDDSS